MNLKGPANAGPFLFRAFFNEIDLKDEVSLVGADSKPTS
jgi:hypothetical protein